MPRFPEGSDRVRVMPGSVYSALAARVYASGGPVFPFHVGDTWMAPPPGCRMEDLRAADHPGMNRYAPVGGLPPLVDHLVEHVRARTSLPVQRSEVLVTAGATSGLSVVIGGLVDPGDEVLILAPYWPLIAGIVQIFGGRPVAVPLLGEPLSPEAAVEAVRSRCTGATVALYLNTPNNPTGQQIPAPVLEALVSWAASQGLWIVVDEVYEDYVYEGQHTPARIFAPERTFSTHSFSKAYGMAGNRAGYVVGPAEPLAQARKVGVHTIYSTPTASQLAALRVLEGAGAPWVEAAASAYAEIGRHAAARLGVAPPQGSTFLWLDVADQLDERGLQGFLEDAGERGLLLAPGPSFGPYPDRVRLCFTATPPEVTREGVERLAALLGR